MRAKVYHSRPLQRSRSLTTSPLPPRGIGFGVRDGVSWWACTALMAVVLAVFIVSQATTKQAGKPSGVPACGEV